MSEQPLVNAPAPDASKDAPPTPGPGVRAEDGKHDTRGWTAEEREKHRSAVPADSDQVDLVDLGDGSVREQSAAQAAADADSAKVEQDKVKNRGFGSNI